MIDKLIKLPLWKMIIFLITFFVVFFYGANIYYKLKDKYADYTNSIYVITQYVTYGKEGTNYYKINKKGNIKKIDSFESDKFTSIYLKDCFDAYINKDKNKVLNSFKEASCQIVDSQMEISNIQN